MTGIPQSDICPTNSRMAKVVPLFPLLFRDLRKSQNDALTPDSALPPGSPIIEVDVRISEVAQDQPNRQARAEDMRPIETASVAQSPRVLARVIVSLKVLAT